MPVTPTYPGVYIQEVDSGSRVVTGVATSITAFIGRTERGPANEPITVFNFGDFERMFGKLQVDMPMPYAVQDFFENGGSQALITRVVGGPPLESAAKVVLGTDSKLTLTAAVKGEVGNKLRLRVARNAVNRDTFDVMLYVGDITKPDAPQQPKTQAQIDADKAAEDAKTPAEKEAEKKAADDAAKKAADEKATADAAAAKKIVDDKATADAADAAEKKKSPEDQAKDAAAAAKAAADAAAADAAAKDAALRTPVVLAESNPGGGPGLTASAVPLWLADLSNIIVASGSLGQDPTSAVEGIADEKDDRKFDGAVDGAGGTPAQFVAGKLKIHAMQGSWADDLNVSIAINSDPDVKTVHGGAAPYVVIGDHPILSKPHRVGFSSWADLKTGLTATGLFTDVEVPAQTVKPFNPAQKALPAAQKNGGTAITPAFPGKAVDLIRTPDGQGAATATKLLGGVTLTAASPGKWGNDLAVYFDKKNINAQVALRFADYGIDGADDFWNVNVVLAKGQRPFATVETIGPVYLGPVDAPCRIDHVLATQSAYLRARAPIGAPGAKDLLQDPTLIKPSKGDDAVGMLSKGNDGESLTADLVVGSETARTGIYALANADLFNIMVIPPDPLLLNGDVDMKSIYQKAAKYCADHRAILIADPLEAWGFKAKRSQFGQIQPTDFDIDAITERRSVFTYFPRIKKADPLKGNREMVFSASGMIAGVFAATDVRRGVWKAPAGVEAGLNGVSALEYKLTDMQNGQLNQVGINVLRDFPVIGKVIWGSRTLAGADAMSDDYKYLPARRLTNYIEESLYRATKFAVFEPNAEPLWATIRLTIGAFMADLARQGAFYDYYVKCDASTTNSNDINLGKCNVIVAFAPVKPAEFIILTIQQLALKPAA